MRGLLTIGFLTLAVMVAGAEDGATVLRQNYRTVLDNAEVEVVRVHYGPHESLPVHDHSHYPTVYVYLSDSGAVRFAHTGTAAYTLMRRAVRKGWFRVSPGRIEQHAVTNSGPQASDFLRVELKQIPLGQIPDEFRYTGHPDLSRNGATNDYTSPQMVIRRYVATQTGSEHGEPEAEPELLVAFTPALVSVAGQTAQNMAAGSVLWIAAEKPFDLRPAGKESAHVLAIRLLGR